MNRKWLFIGGGAAVVLIALIPWPGDSARQTGESVTVYSNAMLTVVRPMPTVIPTPSIPTVAEPRKALDKQAPTTPPAESAVVNLHFEVAESGPYAPSFRLIAAQLAFSVETISIETPIIGLVTQDIWHDGELIVPVGTEIHGRAQADRVRDRIAGQSTWHLVFKDGRVLGFPGILLDQDVNPEGTEWGLLDGSAGMIGQVLRSDTLADVKLFLATALAGLSRGVQPRQLTLLGSQPKDTLESAALNGFAQVMDLYANRVLEAVKRDGIFVRVPAGKQYYIYAQQPLDLSKATRGNQPIETPKATKEGREGKETPTADTRRSGMP